MPASPAGTTDHHRNLKELARRELVRFLVIFAYLWAIFLLFQIHQYVILAEHQIRYENWGFGLINALVLAKVMVIAEEFHFNAWLRTKPLISAAIARSIGFAVLFVLVDILEKILVAAFKGHSMTQSLPTYGSGGLAGQLLVGIMLAFALLPFFAYEELNAVQEGRLTRMLFGVGHRPLERKAD